uniref:F-box domain-containing protein n=1 Tax=Mycena chlorophos TaxID=658473 RepID=A0ABQ0LD18_MYCCL|nr:predicted protein [Mycena chlorophos]
MHPCLALPEIVLQIVQQVSNEPPNATLASLAQTSRLFLEPSLNALWRNPGYNVLLYLARTFPDGALNVTEVGLYGKYRVVRATYQSCKRAVTQSYWKEIRRSLTAADWERPLSYCKRVRVFNHEITDFVRTTNILVLLTTGMPTSFLFPRLQSLYWRSDINGSAFTGGSNSLRFLLPPTIKDLTLVGPIPTVVSHLLVVATKNLSLERLALRPGMTDLATVITDHDIAALSAFVCQLSGLKSLVVPSLDPAALEHISQLQSLEKLHVTRRIPSTGWQALHDCEELFTSLNSLTLENADLLFVTPFIGSLAHSPLQVLEIYPQRTATTGSVAEVFAALSECGLEPSINRIHVCSYHSPEQLGTSIWSLERSSFLVLAKFSNLEYIVLHAPGGFLFGDDALQTVLQSCPRLSSLELTHPLLVPNTTPTQFTSMTLVNIATHSKSLKSLQLTLDLSAPLSSAYPVTSDGVR